MTNRCYYCNRLRSASISVLISLSKLGVNADICIICFLDGKHLPDMGKKWERIRFYGKTEAEIRALPKDFLDKIRENRDHELECIKKRKIYEPIHDV